jgi:hypothetical protein
MQNADLTLSHVQADEIRVKARQQVIWMALAMARSYAAVASWRRAVNT